MKTNKKAGIIRKGFFVVLIIISVFSMVGCGNNEENTTNEYK